MVVCRLESERGTVWFCNIYMNSIDENLNPKNVDEHLNLLNNLLYKIGPHATIVIGTELNCRSRSWNDITENLRGRQLRVWLERAPLVLADSPKHPSTFRAPRSSTSTGWRESWIDLTLVSPNISNSISEWKLLDWCPSDHRCITFNIKISKKKNIYRSQTRLFRETKADWVCFRHIISDESSDLLCLDRSIESACSFAEELVIKAARASIPEICVTKSTVVPWLSQEIKEIQRRLRTLDIRSGCCLVTSDGGELLAERKRLLYQLRSAKRNLKRREYEKFLSCETSEDVLRIAKLIDSPHRTAPSTLILENGQSTSSADETAQALLMSFFLDCKLESQSEETPGPNLSTNPLSSPITSDEITKILAKMRSTGAPGPDHITPNMIRQTHLADPELLRKLYTMCFESGTFPRRWKAARVIAIPKKGKDPKSVKGWRPISLLSVFGKILEALIMSRLTCILEQLIPQQHGFRSGKSTITATKEMVKHIRNNHSIRPKRCKTKYGYQERICCATVAIDISGAFDNVIWQKVIDELTNKNHPPDVTALCRNFFAERIASVLVGDFLCTEKLTKGCPQGAKTSLAF